MWVNAPIPQQDQLQAELAAVLRGLGEATEGKVPGWLAARSPELFRAMELDVAAVARGFADQVTSLVLRTIAADRVFQGECSAALLSGSKVPMRNVDST